MISERVGAWMTGWKVLAAAAGMAAIAGLGAAAPAADRPKLEITLEILRPFTYEGDPLLVRVGVFNTGESPYANTEGIDLLGSLGVSSSGKGRLRIKDKPSFDPKTQPAIIPAGGFFGIIHDVAGMVPDLAHADTYTFSLETPGGWTAPPVTAKVIPKFDPAGAYLAVIETDYGSMEFDLKTKEAPRHVQNFYDLSMQGFYDGTHFHQIIKGLEVRGGDPGGTGNGWPGYLLDREISPALKHSRGTLSMLPSGPRQDNGSQFIITLAPQPRYDGQISIFGQMRSGEETLAAIESIPTSGQIEAPFYRPVKPVLARSVKVRKAQTAGQ